MTKARDEIYFVTGEEEPEWGADNYNPQTADLDRMRAYFQGFHSEVRRVLAACPAATRWPILERAPLPIWSAGRIVLLGDACHPMRPHMGQGALHVVEQAVDIGIGIKLVDMNEEAANLLALQTRQSLSSSSLSLASQADQSVLQLLQ